MIDRVLALAFAAIVGLGSGHAAAAEPLSIASSPQSPVTGQTVVFEASGSSPSGLSVRSYEWSFDGGPVFTDCAETAHAHHVYTDPGVYQVSLRATDVRGLATTVTKELTVGDAGLVAGGLAGGCGGADRGLPPGVRGPPTVKIRAPEDFAYFDAAPASLHVSGELKAPEGLAAFCVTGPAATATPPPNCTHKSFLKKGIFDVPFTGLVPGANFFDAWVLDATGSVAHDEIVVVVADQTSGIDLAAASMEVTQAVQTSELPAGSPASYGGVGLASGGKTIVRFFANAPQPSKFPPRKDVKGVQAALYGYRDGKLLSPSPLLPESGPLDLRPGSLDFDKGVMLAFNRSASSDAYPFVLPPEWTHGTITLVGRVNPVELMPGVVECKTCRANNAFELRKVAFTPTRRVRIGTAKLLYTGAGGLVIVDDAAAAFSGARAVTPLGEGQLETPPYLTTINLDVILPDSDASKTALATLYDWAFWRFYDDVSPPDTYMGIHAGGIRGSTSGSPMPFVSRYSSKFSYRTIAQAGSSRPLTSIAHELGHVIGRPHASKGCGGNDDGQVGEDWPDATGTIQGFGVDRRGSGKGVFALFPPSAIDLMSYCAYKSIPWTSTINWNRELSDLSASASTVVARAAPRLLGVAREHATGRSLRVVGIADASGVRLRTVEPGVSTPMPASGDSGLRLVVRNHAGAVISETAMAAASAHVDPDEHGVGAEPFALLAGEAPATGASRLQVVHGGVVVAERSRSAHPPRVRLLAPGRDARVGGRRPVRIRWRATDLDGDQLTVRVEYSPGGQRAWRPIFLGPDRGRAVVPGRYLSAARNGRVRVLVNDGFDTATAVSRLFTARGGPPTVSIASPLRGARIAADASLYLAGVAFRDSGEALRGKHLRWFAGRRRLGTGPAVSVWGIRPGRRRVRLEARDQLGRIGRDSVVVHIVPVRPRFIRPIAQRRARKAVLRLASTVPATLRVVGRRYRVNRERRSITVPARRRLRLVLAAGGRRSALVVRVRP